MHTEFLLLLGMGGRIEGGLKKMTASSVLSKIDIRMKSRYHTNHAIERDKDEAFCACINLTVQGYGKHRNCGRRNIWIFQPQPDSQVVKILDTNHSSAAR
jgi:hypothetical protein